MTIRQRLAAADPSSASLQRDVSVSQVKVGDVLVAQGDLPGARARFQESLQIAQRLAAADPSSASLQTDMSISFTKLGDVAIAQGVLGGARRYFEQSLAIDQRLAAADPSSASLQRDLIISLVKLQEVTGDRSYAQRALDVARGMQARGQSAPRDAWMIPELQRRAGQ